MKYPIPPADGPAGEQVERRCTGGSLASGKRPNRSDRFSCTFSTFTIMPTCFAGRRLLPLWMALCLLLGACASVAPVRLDEDLADYEDQVEELERQLRRDPNDAEALRDLGIIYLRTGNYARANELLETAFTHTPDDPALLFHLGLVNEVLGRPEAALRVYEGYPDFPRLSPYRGMTASRYRWLQRQLVQDEVLARLAQEQQLRALGQELCGGPADARIVGVYPLGYRGSNERYAPLGRGLAEMVTTDLGYVDELQLVERARLQDLLNEIELASGAQFDPSTAPRVGCLVGAGRLVGGLYNVLDDDLQLDASLWEADDVEDLGTRTGDLRNLFALEKELVFRIIDEIGIELTPEEREAIEFIPTQNLQAFLAYSQGLEREDAGAFAEAARFYRQAATLDPGFEGAQEAADQLEGMTQVAGSISNAMLAAARLDPSLPQQPAFGVDVLSSRLSRLNGSIGALFVPSLEARESAPEAASAGLTLGGLPDPPRPPDQQ